MGTYRMSLASGTTLEKAMGVAIGLMAIELVVRSVLHLSLAVAVFSFVAH